MKKHKKDEIDVYYNRLKRDLRNSSQDVSALIQISALDFEYFHRHKEAVDYLERAINLSPQNSDARFWLAACLYHDFCDYDKAEQVLREALQLAPNRADCLSLLASISWHSGKSLENAVCYLRKAVEAAPDWPLLRHKLATYLLELNQVICAEQEIKLALALEQSPPMQTNNEVEFYYENVVTGRAWTDVEGEFQELIKRVESER
ncbi:MAG: tetratricopeptide repeat protein [Verrucomicrobia bacterium]|nr:tetratricopeptide repeat protein [Verrucomicrobiota bacterium]